MTNKVNPSVGNKVTRWSATEIVWRQDGDLRGFGATILQIFNNFEEGKSFYAKWLVPLAVGSL